MIADISERDSELLEAAIADAPLSGFEVEERITIPAEQLSGVSKATIITDWPGGDFHEGPGVGDVSPFFILPEDYEIVAASGQVIDGKNRLVVDIERHVVIEV